MFDLPSVFPDPCHSQDPEGLLAYSDVISPDLLLDAYAHAIFPWPCEEEQVLWFSPPNRGILFFSNLHIHSRLKRFIRHCGFTFKIDFDFKSVINACASVKRPEEGTWITSKIISSYLQFYNWGYAHSFEAYNDQGKLVGGLYGVGIDRFFGGESMFFYESGASKFALLSMIATLKNCGFQWLDTQMVTSVTESFGAENIDRSDFLSLFRNSVQDIKPITTETLRRNIGKAEDLF